MDDVTTLGPLWVKQLEQEVQKRRNRAAENLMLVKKDGAFAEQHRQLIAAADCMLAAPELLAALQDCVAVMERELGGLNVIQPELRQARSAVAKATGAPDNSPNLRVMVDREADDRPMTKLVKKAQAILAAYLVPIGPSKAETIEQLVELFGGAPFFAALEKGRSADPVPVDPMTALMERVDAVWEKLDQSGTVTTEDVQGLREAIRAVTPARELTDDQVYDAHPHGAQHTDDGRYVVNDEWLQDFAHNILTAAAGAK